MAYLSFKQELEAETPEEFLEIFVKSMDEGQMRITDALIQTKIKDPRFVLDINQCTVLAAMRGNSLVLSKLLALRPRMSYGDSQNRRAIHYAAKNGHFDCVGLLLKAGAISNCSDEFGHTPLHLACANGHIDIVRLLVQQCAHINSCRTETGENAVHITAAMGNIPLMELLLEHGGDMNLGTKRGKGGETALHKAVAADHPDMVDFLCQQGAKLSIADAHGKYPIHIACEKGFLHCISILTEHGASLEVTDGQFQTPLGAAVAENQTEVAKLLIDQGAKVNAFDKSGFTSLHKASVKENLEIIDHLVHAGANVNAQSQTTHQTPLMTAVSFGKLHAIRKLVALGADVELADAKGHTPLHMAHLKTGGELVEDIVMALLEGGGRLDVRDQGHLTPLERGLVTGVIRQVHSMPCIQLLCQAGSELGPNEFTMGKKSPLFWLAYSGFLQEALYLVRAGWDLNLETWVVLPGKDERHDRLHSHMVHLFKTVPSLMASCRKVLRTHLTTVRQHREILSTVDCLPIPGPLKSYLKLLDIDPEDTAVLDPED